MEKELKMNNEPVIRTRGLTRYFGSKAAVRSLDLEVPRGCVFALLGRNGSGKTTTIRMLLGLLQPTRGEGRILGQDIRNLPPEARAQIGYLTEGHQVYGWMTVRECAAFQSRFFAAWNPAVCDSVMAHFGLSRDARVKDLSRGERAGLCLALTLAPEPELLILDDPALGLDPVARRSLVEAMVQLTRRADRTIVFSSHQLADVERVADYIAVLDRGVLRASCPVEVFRSRLRQVCVRFKGAPPPLPKLPGLVRVSRSGNEVRLVCVGYNNAAEAALRSLDPEEFTVGEMALEEAFLSYLAARGETSSILPEPEMEACA